MYSSPRATRDSHPSAPATADGAVQKAGARRWLFGLERLFATKPSDQKAADANALLAFPSEAVGRGEAVADVRMRVAPRPKRPSPISVRAGLIVLAVAVLAGLGVFAFLRYPELRAVANEPRPGNLTINTRPNNSEVLVDGVRRGATPLTLALMPGPHTITVRNENDERVVPLTITGGADVTQYFELKTTEPTVDVGRVSVVTDPPGARVAIDGRPRGISPVTVADLTPADHKVSVTSDTGSIERTVTVSAGGTASVMFSLPKASGPVGGWLSLATPFDVEVVEHDDVIGTGGANGTSRFMLAAGRHDITLVNRSLGYQDERTIDVSAGKTMSVRVDPPKVSVSVNARPWAEVTLDGSSVGQTPIANLLVTIGPHEMMFRHPQLGERRQTVVVTAKGANRIAADLTK